jgi:hypothetical protein
VYDIEIAFDSAVGAVKSWLTKKGSHTRGGRSVLLFRIDNPNSTPGVVAYHIVWFQTVFLLAALLNWLVKRPVFME